MRVNDDADRNSGTSRGWTIVRNTRGAVRFLDSINCS